MSGLRLNENYYTNKPDIHRQETVKHINENLLVFGYHCKIFRDDSNAMYIKNEKHLIPWMGDENLMIDRYDCRGHLYNSEEFSSNFDNGSINNTDIEIERQCDLERYADLHATERSTQQTNFDAEQQERFIKLSSLTSSNYDTVGYHYDSQALYDPEEEEYKDQINAMKDQRENNGDNDDIDAARQSQIAAKAKAAERLTSLKYKTPEGLHIPSDIEVPEGMKLHAIIEKTATFISKHGIQMEIVLKAKQAGNPQFEFLNFGNWLNPYYKIVLEQIKTGKYIPSADKIDTDADKKEEEPSSSETDNDSDGEYELHPLLQVNRRPTATSASSTKDSAQDTAPEVRHSLPIIPFSPGDFVKQYMARKYASRSHLHGKASPIPGSPSNQDGSNRNTPEREGSPRTHMINEDASRTEHDVDDYLNEYYTSLGYDPEKCKEYISSLAYSYLNSIGQKVHSSSTLPPPPLPPGIDDDDETLSWLKAAQIPKLSDILSSMTYEQLSQFQKQLPSLLAPPPPPPGTTVVEPPMKLKVVIDKLAEYSVKNGDAFEEGIRQKSDPRFEFLLPSNTYNTYYVQKKTSLLEARARSLVTGKTPAFKTKERSARAPGVGPRPKAEPLDSSAKPVRFAFKKKANDSPLPVEIPIAKEAFPEEEEEDQDTIAEDEVSIAPMDGEGYRPQLVVQPKASSFKSEKVPTETDEERENRLALLQQQKLEEEELRQKFAEQARLAKERLEIQQERRRRAAAFIGMLKQSKEEPVSNSNDEKEEDIFSEDQNPKHTNKRHFTEVKTVPQRTSESEESLSPPSKTRHTERQVSDISEDESSASE